MQSFEMLAATGDPFALTEYQVLGEKHNHGIECDGCCPLMPNDCDDHCTQKGFKKGECVGGIVKDECFCSN